MAALGYEARRLVNMIRAYYDLDFERMCEHFRQQGLPEPEPSRFR